MTYSMTAENLAKANEQSDSIEIVDADEVDDDYMMAGSAIRRGMRAKALHS